MSLKQVVEDAIASNWFSPMASHPTNITTRVVEALEKDFVILTLKEYEDLEERGQDRYEKGYEDGLLIGYESAIDNIRDSI